MVNKLNMCKVMLKFGFEGLQKIYQANVNHVDIGRDSGLTDFRFLSGYSQNELKKYLTEYQAAFDSFKKLDNATAKLSFYIGSRYGKERIKTVKKVMCSYQGCFHGMRFPSQTTKNRWKQFKNHALSEHLYASV